MYIAPYTPFTPGASTPSSTPPATFVPPASTASVVAPAPFFPVVLMVENTIQLAQNPTKTTTPGPSEIVYVVGLDTWTVYTLTAGIHSADSGHIPPLDYDTNTNAKYWVPSATGSVVNNQLIDSSGNALTDSNGNPLIFA